MKQTINIRENKRWNVMRHDLDINPVTGQEEKVPQCIFSSTSPVSDKVLNELRKKYAAELWIEPTTVIH